ncbi:hypothetical protein H5410_031620 [Solanum commersonii]|uniref:Uncharacterized protein n=1 Tax=Solanum commersonii TaxID=4109 RepID=A0A9J5YIT6_SOLCO|nr:hypothetical protein H5410_031620 [Solanum commersonii]
MQNAIIEVHNNATNLIDEPIVELGKQLSQNKSVTSDGVVIENFELCKANFVRQGNDEQGKLIADNTILQAEKCNNEEDNKDENWTLVAYKNSAGSQSYTFPD